MVYFGKKIVKSICYTSSLAPAVASLAWSNHKREGLQLSQAFK